MEKTSKVTSAVRANVT